MEQRDAQLTVFQEISEQIGRAEQVEQILRRALLLLREHFGFGLGRIYRLSPTQKEFWLYLSEGEVGTEESYSLSYLDGGVPADFFDVTEDEWIYQAWQEQKAMVRPQPFCKEELGMRNEELRIKKEEESLNSQFVIPNSLYKYQVVLPLRYRNKGLGVLWLQRVSNPIESAELSFLVSIANLLAGQIEQWQTVQQLNDELQEVRILYGVQHQTEAIHPVIGGAQYGYQYQQESVKPLAAWPSSAKLALAQDISHVQSLHLTGGEAMVAPIRVAGQTIGLLGLESEPLPGTSLKGLPLGADWRADDMRLLEEVSLQVAGAIENARLWQQTQERTHELGMLFETSRRLTETIDPSQIYHILGSQILSYVQGDVCWVAIGQDGEVANRRGGEVKESGTGLQVILTLQRQDDTILTVESPTFSMGGTPSILACIISERWQEQTEVVITHFDPPTPSLLSTLSGTSPNGSLSANTLSGTSGNKSAETVVTFPLVVRNKQVGLLSVGHYHGHRNYSDNELQLGKTMVTQAMVAIENAQLFQQTQVSLQETQKLYEISRALVEASTAEDIYEIVLQNVKAFGIDRVSISLFERSSAGDLETVIAASWDRQPGKASAVGTRFKASNFSLVDAFAHPPFYPLISLDLSTPENQDPRMDDAFRQFVHREYQAITLFSAPMFLGAEYKGVMSIYTRQAHQYTEQEVRIYQTLADQAIIAVENHRLLEATLVERDRVALLYEIGQALNGAGSLEEVMGITLGFSPALGAIEGRLYLIEQGVDSKGSASSGRGNEGWVAMGSSLAIRQGSGHPGATSHGQALAQRVLGHGLEGQVLEQGELAVEVGTAEKWAVDELELGELYHPSGVLYKGCVPLRVGRSQLRGVLTFYQKGAEGFSPNQLSTFEALALQVARTLENVQLLQQTASALQETELLYEASRDFNASQSVTELLQSLVNHLSMLDFGFSLEADPKGSQPLGSAPPLDWVGLIRLERIPSGVQGSEAVPIFRLAAEWIAGRSVSPSEGRFSVVEYPFLEKLKGDSPGVVVRQSTEIAGRWRWVMKEELGIKNEEESLNSQFVIPNSQIQLPPNLLSLLGIPLQVGRDWLGLLLLGSRVGEYRFNEAVINQLTALAGQVAVVMQNLQLVAETQRNLYQAKILSELGERALAATTSEGIYQACLSAIAQTVPERGAFIFHQTLIDGKPAGNFELVGIGDFGLKDNDIQNPKSKIQNGDEPIQNLKSKIPNPKSPFVVGSEFAPKDLEIQGLVRNGQTVVIGDTQAEPRFGSLFKEMLSLMQLQSLVAVPLWVNRPDGAGQVVGGFMMVGHAMAKEDPFRPETIKLYEEIARRTSEALAYQRVFEEANYRSQLLQTTAEISQTATGSLDLELLLPQTVELIRRRLELYHVSIYLVDEYQSYALFQAGTGEAGERMRALHHKLEVGGKSLVGSVSGSGKARLVADVGREERYFRNPLLPHSRSALALPLMSRGRVIGALEVLSVRVGAFGQHDIAILQSMANQLANAIEAARAFQESRESLERMSRLQEHYLREQWGMFMREQEGAIGYRFNQLGEWQEIRRGDSITNDELGEIRNYECGIKKEEVPNSQFVIRNSPNSHLIAPLMLHGQAVIGALDFELKQSDFGLGILDWGLGDHPQSQNPNLKSKNEIIQNQIGEDDMRIIEAVAGQAAQAIESARMFEQTQSAREEAEALYKVVRTLVTTEDEGEMYRAVMRELLGTLGLKNGGIVLFDREGQRGSMAVLVKDKQPLQSDWVVAVAADEIFQTLRREKKSMALDFRADTGGIRYAPQGEGFPIPNPQSSIQNPLVSDFYLRLRVVSMLVVPLVMEDEVRGAVLAHSPDKRFLFNERAKTLAGAMVDQLSITLQNRRLLEETKRRAVQLQTSADVGRVATSILDQESMLAQAVELIKERFGFYHVQIFLVDDLEQYAVLHQSTGEIGRRLLELNHKVAIGSRSVIGQVTARRESLVVRLGGIKNYELGIKNEELGMRNYELGIKNEEVPNSQFLIPNSQFLIPETKAELAVPLVVGERLLGVLDVQSREADVFTREEMATMEVLAAQLAIALQNARAFREQQETAQRLREVDKLKTQFLANMSHELRTPLNSIIGFSRVILKGIDGPLTEMQKADLTSIHGSGQHLLGLINNILDLSKIEAGKMELNPEEIDMGPIIKQVMSTAIALVKDRPVRLRTDINEDLPLVWADPTRIRQVILNLVSNACKFTDEGEVVIRAFASTDKVTVRVSDSGIGIPKEDLSKVFEEFTQVDASTTRKVGGTGLGLPISRHFIEMHKGQIWVESEFGTGSTFSFAIPIRPLETTAEEKAAETVAAGVAERDGRKRLIVAIDDDAGVIALYKRFLDKQGYEVIGINDSKNVVARVKHYAPTAILLDVLIPEKDGWTVLRELKEDPVTQAIPVVVCSIVSDKNRGFSLGATDYLIKPIVENELIRALRNLEVRERDQVRVLVIDDHADDVLLVRRILEAHGNYKVMEANNGWEGLKLVQRMRPDLIVLDLNMPEMNGFEVVEALKQNEQTRSIPIIIASAQELSPAEHEFLNNQVEVLLRKGIFTENELLEDVSRALKGITGIKN